MPSGSWFKRALIKPGLFICLGQGALAYAAEPPTQIWLLGEVHDNAEGHAQRMQWLTQQVRAGLRPAIVMEQFDRGQQASLDQALQTCKTAQCITAQPWLEPWDWLHYEPVIQLAIDFQLPLLAANVSRTEVNRIFSGGYQSVFDSETIARYRLDQPLPADLQAGHRVNIEQGHCNMLPPAVVEKMIPAQVARDVWMARTIEQQVDKTPVVLIAGNGHVDRLVGVYRWLPVKLQQRTQVHAYLEGRPASGSASFDVVQTVPPAKREDPCEAFKAMMKK